MSYVEKLLATNEKIILATRQHAFVLLLSIARNLIGAIIAFVIAVVLQGVLPRTIDRPLIFALQLILLLIPVFSFLREYARWLSEEYFLTNRRVIQSAGVINKRVIDSSLDKVNDVVMRQTMLGRLMDYADIEILTASEAGINLFRRVPQPIKFKTEMLNQREALAVEERGGFSSAE
ncbi:MAG: PH domain-containing protein, partial [Chloroflexi bacterium]|nr:PH domain-containing protein [Chloroflexota bacterium]